MLTNFFLHTKLMLLKNFNQIFLKNGIFMLKQVSTWALILTLYLISMILGKFERWNLFLKSRFHLIQLFPREGINISDQDRHGDEVLEALLLHHLSAMVQSQVWIVVSVKDLHAELIWVPLFHRFFNFSLGLFELVPLGLVFVNLLLGELLLLFEC